ncbi:MAG: hypothetical protein R3279_03000 [Putridiphycobacter sp.]|nr:hypothetical protein [Putridiphycobacter sp.]
MKNFVNISLIIISLVIFGLRIAKSIEFKQNVSGYLKRAGDANTIDLAHEELSKALLYLEANNLTKGHTSILYKTPDEDIDFWYRNLKASQSELENLESESALERTNVLIKLRETLLDTGEKTKVTVPKGLAVYPNNFTWALLMWLAIIVGTLGFMRIAIYIDKQSKSKKKSIKSS